MANPKNKIAYSAFFGLIALSIIGLVVPFTMALYEKGAESDGIHGTVALRSYFDSGTGDPGDPYVITRPRHLYNLSRLQTFGVFKNKTYFQLGKLVNTKYLCYTNDVDSDMVPFLDMKNSRYDYERILAIGSEAEPFYGEFDGKGLEIKNLNVYADPEDAGLFGYTAHGSKVHDLFLDKITVHALGYESTFADLYGPGQVAAVGTSFKYYYKNGDIVKSDTFSKSDTSKVQTLEFDAKPIFKWNKQSEEDEGPAINDPAPVITFNSSNELYKYKFLISGDFLKYNGSDQSVTLDLKKTYKFFKEKREAQPALTYPINASSSVYLVASTTDSLGIGHSKVISTLEFDFSLATESTSILTMLCRLGDEHHNNIGLVVGHCDGSINHCYVSEGEFVMNKGLTDTGEAHVSMANGSNTGRIGLIGGTVHNIAAEESGAGTVQGKQVGILDFSTIYDDVITSSSFNNSVYNEYYGYNYKPSTSLKYSDYLRKKDDVYYTLEPNALSLNGKQVISNNDLGVFTVATDYFTTGMGDEVGYNQNFSVVRDEDTSVNGDYFIYYSTAEYQKTGAFPLSDYLTSMGENNPHFMHLGYHLPETDNLSVESFDKRDTNHNYFFRFKIDPEGRSSKKFYFADIDKSTPGGSFISHYFEHKLVDKDGNPITADSNDPKSGVMLRNSLGYEISKLTSSFATPDLSLDDFGDPRYMYTLPGKKPGDHDYAANMVNFEIKTPVANVTVVAGLVDTSVPAALGVYEIGDSVPRLQDGNNNYIDVSYDEPDYAFFMPTDSHLAYFDYAYDNSGKKWDLGVYSNDGSVFTPATTHTPATLCSEYDVLEYGKPTGQNPPTRLFAHTFKLPEGRYCLGSASPGLAKIFYVCAQGQTDGDLDFDDNTFASDDKVENVDFINGPRFTYVEGNPTNYETNFSYDVENPHIETQRCYVALINNDRSSFKASELDIKFKYTSGVFYITTTGSTDNVNHIAVTTFASDMTEGQNIPVSLFDGDPVSTGPVVFPPAA